MGELQEEISSIRLLSFQTVDIQFALGIGPTNRVMSGPDVDFSIGHDRRSELDPVSGSIARVLIAAVNLCKSTGVIGS
jgi:hypothetical protein